MTKTLSKIIYRLIKDSHGRFLSIMLLLALGTTTLVGLKSTGSDISRSANKYFDKLNIMGVSIIGIGLGLAFGKILHDTIISYVAPPQIMFTPGVEFWAYIVPSITVVTILTVLGIYANHTLKQINMLEALKSVD